MHRAYASWMIALLLAACATPPQPIAIAPAGEGAEAAVERRLVAEPPAVASLAPTAPAAVVSAPPVVVPAGALYVCVSETDGRRQQTTIEFPPKVGEMCRKHPEMGPCQYEREVCRSSGGRVYAANSVEITRQTEAEYDRKVMRVRFNAE